jgi:hypothetical protein
VDEIRRAKAELLKQHDIIVSWFSGNWNDARLLLANGEGHPTKAVAASCREGLAL